MDYKQIEQLLISGIKTNMETLSKTILQTMPKFEKGGYENPYWMGVDMARQFKKRKENGDNATTKPRTPDMADLNINKTIEAELQIPSYVTKTQFFDAVNALEMELEKHRTSDDQEIYFHIEQRRTFSIPKTHITAELK